MPMTVTSFQLPYELLERLDALHSGRGRSPLIRAAIEAYVTRAEAEAEVGEAE